LARFLENPNKFFKRSSTMDKIVINHYNVKS